MPISLKTTAIVINSIQYGESDLIVTFLTEGHGLVKGFARGALKSRKRFAGCFEPFTVIGLGFTQKESGGLARVESADIIKPHYGIRADLDRIAAGAAMLELVSTVEVAGGEGEAFGLLSASLGMLENTDAPVDLGLAFIVKYLDISGFKVPHESCCRCGAGLKGKRAVYAGGEGLLCGTHGKEGAPVISPGTLAFIGKAESIEAAMLGRLRLTGGSRRELLDFLKSYIHIVVGRKMKTLTGGLLSSSS